MGQGQGGCHPRASGEAGAPRVAHALDQPGAARNGVQRRLAGQGGSLRGWHPETGCDVGSGPGRLERHGLRLRWAVSSMESRYRWRRITKTTGKYLLTDLEAGSRRSRGVERSAPHRDSRCRCVALRFTHPKKTSAPTLNRHAGRANRTPKRARQSRGPDPWPRSFPQVRNPREIQRRKRDLTSARDLIASSLALTHYRDLRIFRILRIVSVS
jgi:hypothetical protein